jgi:hypothetical protein
MEEETKHKIYRLEKKRRNALMIQVIVSIPTAFFIPKEVGIPFILCTCAVVILYCAVYIQAKIKRLRVEDPTEIPRWIEGELTQ